MKTLDQLRWKLSEEFIGFREGCPNHDSSVCSTCCDLGYVPKTVLSLLDVIDNLDVSISKTQKGIRYVTVCTYWGGEYYGEAESVDLALCQAIANFVFHPDNDSLEDEDADDDDD